MAHKNYNKHLPRSKHSLKETAKIQLQEVVLKGGEGGKRGREGNATHATEKLATAVLTFNVLT